MYLGAIIFPDYMVRRTTGFYLVPLFGVAANWLVLTGFWFVGIRLMREMTGQKSAADPNQT